MNKIIAKSFINNEYIETNNIIKVNSPIDNKELGEVCALSQEHIDLAYSSASKAFETWKNIDHLQRIEFIKKFAEFFIQDKENLAKLITLEVAKSYKDSLVEVERSYEYIINTIDVYLNEIHPPKVIDESVHKIKNKVGKFYNEPIGVVLAISPFNYPINLSIAKIIPTIIVGNTLVFKPATYGSLVCSKLSEYFLKANFPKGVFNLVMGKGSEIGDYILKNESIKGITFTGSTKIGKQIAKNANMQNLVLELGGKDPALVLDDVDVNKVGKEIVKGAYNFSGQRCTAIKRVVVLSSIADQLVESIKKEVELLTVGNPFDNVDIVPVIDTKSLNYIQELIDDALNKNAKLILGNKVIGHNLLTPTLIDYVTPEHRLAWEEPFGPVLPIIRVNSIEEGIKIINDSNFGLQASIFGNNINLLNEIATKIDVGTVNINKSSSRGPDYFPFIGVKDSGFGVQGIADSMKAMTRIKGIVNNN